MQESYREIDICNWALSICGSSPITTIEEPKTAEEIECKRWYESARRNALIDIVPSFATIRTFIQKEVDYETNSKYKYAYKKPYDCIRLLEIVQDDNKNYTIENDLILSNYDDEKGLPVFYLFDNTNTQSYDFDFCEYLSYVLASKICYNITKDKTLLQMINNDKMLVGMRIRANERRENKIIIKNTSQYLQSRVNNFNELNIIGKL